MGFLLLIRYYKKVMEKMKRATMAIALIVIIVIGFGGYWYFGIRPTAGITHPETFVMESIGEPDYLDPAVDYETAGGEILQNVYETLVWYKGASAVDLEGMLATDWTISDDGLEYTFTLRQGVKFHDGTPFNASCVKYSLDRAILIGDPDGPFWILAQCIKGGPAYMDFIYSMTEDTTQGEIDAAANDYLAAGGVTVIDDYTVKITLEFPYAPFLYCLAYTVADIVSPSFVEAHGGITNGAHNEYMDEHTCGTGPFKMVAWDKLVSITLERNDNYWRTPAKLERVIIKRVEETDTRIMAIEVGDADCIYWPTTVYDRVYDKTTKTSTNPDLRVVAEKPTFDVMFLGFNLNIKPFDNIDIRKAFSYAFDYETFIDEVIYGFGTQLQGPIPKGMFGHNDTLWMYSYDLEKAKDILDDYAWTAENKSIALYYNSGNPIREKACMLLKDAIESLGLGIEVTVNALIWADYLSMLRASQLPLYFLGWAPDYADPDDYVFPFCRSTGTFAYEVGYSDTQMDAWIDAAGREVDPNKRIELYGKIQDKIMEDCVFIWVYQATNFHVERTWVKGYYFNPMYSGLYYYALSKEW